VAAQSRAAEPTYRGADLHIRLEPMQPYLVSQVRPAILALMGAVMFLLLIACSNVANLFLVRASLRGRDLAVRTAMGASWWRLARQMLAEALLVAAIGSALGFGLARAGIHDLLAIAPANLPRLDSVRIDPAVLAFSMGAGLAAAVLFGLAPALRAARPDVAQVLRASGRTTGLSGGSLLRNAVVVAEVALCFVLLVGSGLMFRSFLALQRINPGFDPRGVLTFRTTGGGAAVAHQRLPLNRIAEWDRQEWHSIRYAARLQPAATGHRAFLRHPRDIIGSGNLAGGAGNPFEQPIQQDQSTSRVPNGFFLQRPQPSGRLNGVSLSLARTAWLADTKRTDQHTAKGCHKLYVWCVLKDALFLRVKVLSG
jgi:hypothetical protein